MHDLVIPAVLLLMLMSGMLRRRPVYDAFLQGAKRGLDTAVAILPCLVAMLVAVAMLEASGAMDALLRALSPFLGALGIPEGSLPVMLMRPFSGSASLALLEKTFTTYGPDSRDARTAAVMMGSSETIFYTASLYLAAAKVKKARHAIPAALVAWFVGSIVSAAVVG